MKYIVAMQTKYNNAKTAVLNLLKKQEGQNTVEYIIMLAVIVGIVLAVGGFMKSMMPEVFENVKAKIIGGVNAE